MLRLAVAIAFGSLVYGKTFLQTAVQVKSLGRNVELDGISYFVPGWAEVKCFTILHQAKFY